MAYVIGSKKGQDIAKNMTVGSTYKASDGSVWTKKSDGSVSVTHNGQTTDNAYKQTGASLGKGVASGGGSPGTKTNTSINYTPYSIGSDLGKQVAQNLGIGQTFTATDGSLWKKENDGTITVNHNGQITQNAWKPTDLGTLGQQQIKAGLPQSYVEQTYYDRLNKIAGNPELEQYRTDGYMQMMLDYIRDQGAQEQYEGKYEELNENRPDEYTNPYKAEIDYLLNQILNRDDFSYDAAKDPLYQQYRDMYLREGDRAMKETMAEAAAGAGGMNTYAITAAQQAANYYNSQLNDRIPELYQLAYEMYLNDKESKVQNLGILQNMDNTQYSRYRDTMNDFKDDRNFAYGMYQDALNQGNLDREFAYGVNRDNRDFAYDDFWNNKKWEHDIGREQIEDSRYDDEVSRDERDIAYSKVLELIANGATTIDAGLVKSAGLDQATVNQMIASEQAKRAQNGAASGGRSGSGGSVMVYSGNDTAITTDTQSAYNKAIKGATPAERQQIALDMLTNGEITVNQYQQILERIAG